MFKARAVIITQQSVTYDLVLGNLKGVVKFFSNIILLFII